MPQVICKGLKEEEVKLMSRDILDEISKISSTPRDYFTFEFVNNKIFIDGIEKMYPLIELKQFKREDEIEKNMAETIAKYIKSLGYSECEVFFEHLQEKNYFEL